MRKQRGDSAEEMRRYGTGSYNHVSCVWRIKEKKDKNGKVIRPNLAKSTKQLGDILGCDVPKSEAGSRPYWMRFLQMVKDQQQKAKAAKSPLPERIRSLESLINDFKAKGRDTASLEIALRDAQSVSEWDTDHSDGPILHPDLERHGAILDTVGNLDDMTVRVLNSLAPKPIASKDSLFAEIDRYIGLKANSPPIKLSNIKKVLGHFKDVAGPIRLQDLDSSVWANWHHFVNVNNSWGPTTKRDKDKLVRSFMHYLAGKHNLPFGFLKVKEYKFAEPDGNKEQWTLEQVKEALATATDKNRTILLLGLNSGQIQEDITTNIPDMISDGRLTRVRQKNTWQVKPLKGTWHLWNETSKAMRYDIQRFGKELKTRARPVC